MNLLRSFAIVLVMLTGTPTTATTTLATIRFATTCANCHEGECSGRLSFARQPRMTFAHIRRYAGPVDETLAQELYEALEWMKANCRYPPLQGPDPARAIDAPEADAYRDARSSAYFIPLHGLQAVPYRLSITFDGDGPVRIEVIDSSFDPLVDERMDVSNGRLTVSLPVPEQAHGYLRLRPCAQLRIRGLRFETLDEGRTQPGLPSIRGRNSIGR